MAGGLATVAAARTHALAGGADAQTAGFELGFSIAAAVAAAAAAAVWVAARPRQP
jgi:hypothetical protein